MSKRIGIIILIGFVALVHASCDKSNGSVSTQEEKALIDFAAKSQSAATKGDPLSDYHEDFGVWGIARKSGQMDYMLWEPSAMTKVERQVTTDIYAPVEDAFWLGGYTYNFIAVAPWEAADDISSITYDTDSGTESLTFPFDLAGKYGDGVYNFDLMAAVAETPAKASATDYDQQPLVFWHLLSQINIKVEFVNADGTKAHGSVSQIRIYNVDQDASYTISSEDGSIKVDCQEGDRKYDDTPIIFNESNNSSWTFNIVPQDRRPFRFFMDFTLVKGNDTVAYRDFEVNLDPEGDANPEYYGYNEMYNWNIKIGPKATISFSIDVKEWGVSDVPDGDDDNDNNEVEII